LTWAIGTLPEGRRFVNHATRGRVVNLLATVILASGCRSAAPAIRFAPPGTDNTSLRRDYALSDADRLALTPDNLRNLPQEQVDQIYARLTGGPIPDGPLRGDLFFPRDRDGHATVGDLADLPSGPLGDLAALRAERLGRAFWKGKVFFRAQGILRNRIEDLAILRPLLSDSATIPKLTFDGETTWLLFPARVSCGESALDPSRPSIVIDYSKGSEIEGYRPVPDKLAGADGLNIRDEIRFVRPGFYLGRAYFGKRFGLNFTLVDPANVGGAPRAGGRQEDCGASRAASPAMTSAAFSPIM
jgi:hypothetical protein